MRVAIDATDVGPAGKGVSRALSNIVRSLVEHPACPELTVLATHSARAMFRGVDAEVVEVPVLRSGLWELWGMSRYRRRVGADVIYTMHETGPLRSAAVVYHIHEDPMLRAASIRRSPKARAHHVYQQMTMQRCVGGAAAVVVSSRATAQAICSRFRLPRMPTVVPLGVEALFFDRPHVDRTHLFHLGSADPRDNTGSVIRAYGHVQERLRGVPPLVIAGDLGPLGGPLAALAERSGLGSRVWFRGRVSDPELVGLYAGAVLTIQPAEFEGFGLQPLEAAASGSAVVVVETPAVVETLGNGAAAFASSSRPDDLARAIVGLLRDERSLAAFRHRGNRAARRYTWDNTADGLVKVFDDVKGTLA